MTIMVPLGNVAFRWWHGRLWDRLWDGRLWDRYLLINHLISFLLIVSLSCLRWKYTIYHIIYCLIHLIIYHLPSYSSHLPSHHLIIVDHPPFHRYHRIDCDWWDWRWMVDCDWRCDSWCNLHFSISSSTISSTISSQFSM